MRNPVVSIIVRTVGRASLVRSIEAALAQAWRPLEIIVVHAREGALPRLPPGREVPVRVVGNCMLNRPQAANAGLAAVSGDWIVFVDDDDYILPSHVDSLMACVALHPAVLVAYSATARVDAQGRLDGVIHQPFDRALLMEANYIQMGAALFSRALVVAGCRFDEAFECLQDWDFWLQLAERTDFAFTGRATNHWWTQTGGSGTGGGANGDRRNIQHFRAMLRRKWARQARPPLVT